MKFKWMGQGNPLIMPSSSQIGTLGRGPPLRVLRKHLTLSKTLLSRRPSRDQPCLDCSAHASLPYTCVYTFTPTYTHKHISVSLCLHFFKSSYCSRRKPGRLFDPYYSKEKMKVQTEEVTLSRSTKTGSKVFIFQS